MDLYGQQSRSIPQKTVIHLIELLLIGLSYWILFRSGGTWVEKHLHISLAAENTERRLVIFAFNIVTFLRLAYGMIFLVKRRIPWEESVSVPLAFALYYVGFSLFVLPESVPLDGLDYFAVALFLLGCLLNTAGEILRERWKRKPENKGKIYTLGFFKYSRHINYFGDLLWVAGYALVTRNWYAVSVPVLLFCFFAFYNAPKLDQYLKEKYGADYDTYARKTKMLIPFIF
jgi:protein-S-isoprenylcysteine O-methyltransferase Ste14